jgi:hypothetical protein
MNSLEFINKRISENSIQDKNLANIDWAKSIVWHPIKMLKTIWIANSKEPKIIESLFHKDEHIVLELKGEKEGQGKKVNIIYKSDIAPSFYRQGYGRHDGTLLFVEEIFVDLFKTLIEASSYDKNVMPENYLNDDVWWQYDINYYVSDVLWDSQFVNHVSEKENKMFPGQEDNMIMAVQIEYLYNK